MSEGRRISSGWQTRGFEIVNDSGMDIFVDHCHVEWFLLVEVSWQLTMSFLVLQKKFGQHTTKTKAGKKARNGEKFGRVPPGASQGR